MGFNDKKCEKRQKNVEKIIKLDIILWVDLKKNNVWP